MVTKKGATWAWLNPFTNLWPLSQHGGSGQDWGYFGGHGCRGTPKQPLGGATGRRHARRGEWQQAADTHVGENDRRLHGWCGYGWSGMQGRPEQEPYLLGTERPRGQERTGVKGAGRPTLG